MFHPSLGKLHALDPDPFVDYGACMSVSDALHACTNMPVRLGLIAAGGLTATEVGTYWDDSWHTDRGRDEFAIPPHLLLYGGVTVAAVAVAVWGLLAWRSAGWSLAGLRTVLGDPAMRLAGIGGVVTLASAPVDNWWHNTFGRDAVLWSPPHLAAVAGVLALVVGLSAGLRTTVGTGARAARLFAGAGVIGALQVLVLEYDSGVPQFSTIWYLPVAALALCAAYALLDDLLPSRWGPAEAALVYTLLRAGSVAFLSAFGFSLTIVPPLLIPLLALGLLAGLPLAARLVLLGAVSPLVWWPLLQWQSSVTTTVPASQLAAAVFLGIAGGLVVALVHGDLRRGPVMTGGMRAALILGMLVVVLAQTPGRAWAHDPGQGTEVQKVKLAVVRTSGQARLEMVIAAGCSGFEPLGVTARRAGQTRTGALKLTERPGGGCLAVGSVAGLSPGRWFVYAELKSSAGEALEAWLPSSGDGGASEVRSLYAPPPGGQEVGLRRVVGPGLLLISAGVLIACLRLARRVSGEIPA